MTGIVMTSAVNRSSSSSSSSLSPFPLPIDPASEPVAMPDRSPVCTNNGCSSSSTVIWSASRCRIVIASTSTLAILSTSISSFDCRSCSHHLCQCLSRKLVGGSADELCHIPGKICLNLGIRRSQYTSNYMDSGVEYPATLLQWQKAGAETALVAC